MRRSSDGRMERALALLARSCVIAALCVLGIGGCASDTSGGDEPRAATTATPAVPAAAASTATLVSETPPAQSASKTPKAAAPKVAAPQFARCDANISVRAATTTCGFAQNVFYSFFMEAEAFEQTNAIRAYSPASREHYRLSCKTSAAERVRCVASDGGEVRFDLAAMLDYDDEQAARYARTHDVGPSSDDAEEGSGGSSNDDYSSPDPDPGYGDEIPNYDEGRGYRVRCADGMYSKSGGIQGACSHHGGLADGPTSSDSAPSYDPPSPSSGGGTVHVDGYYRTDGTYVRPHTRKPPCSYC